MNHTLFWENLTPDETAPGPETTKAIAEAFGDLDALKADMSAKTVAVQGSGWGWLGYNTATKRIEIATCANQDPLQATTGLVPLLGIVSTTKESLSLADLRQIAQCLVVVVCFFLPLQDVWEHAYYVDYRNVRPDYVKNIWSVIDWQAVEARLVAAK